MTASLSFYLLHVHHHDHRLSQVTFHSSDLRAHLQTYLSYALSTDLLSYLQRLPSSLNVAFTLIVCTTDLEINKSISSNHATSLMNTTFTKWMLFCRLFIAPNYIEIGSIFLYTESFTFNLFDYDFQKEREKMTLSICLVCVCVCVRWVMSPQRG